MKSYFLIALCLVFLLLLPVSVGCSADEPYYSADEVIAMAGQRYEYALAQDDLIATSKPIGWQAEYQGEGKWSVSVILGTKERNSPWRSTSSSGGLSKLLRRPEDSSHTFYWTFYEKTAVLE